MKDRAKKAAKRYLELQGYESLGTCRDFLVCEDDDGIAFVNVCWNKGSFISSNPTALRDEFEDAMYEWFNNKTNDEIVDIPIRLDEISLNILSDNRALLRHVIGVQNGEH